jgi:hypothetical protein
MGVDPRGAFQCKNGGIQCALFLSRHGRGPKQRAKGVSVRYFQLYTLREHVAIVNTQHRPVGAPFSGAADMERILEIWPRLSIDNRNVLGPPAATTSFANGDSLRGKVLLCRVSPFWHQPWVKPDEKEGKPVKSDSVQTVDRQADLIDFVQLARSAESVFETARFNRSRTSPCC